MILFSVTSRFEILSLLLFIVVYICHRRWLRYYRNRVGDIRTIDDTTVSWHLWPELRRMTRIALPTIFSSEGLGTLVFIILFGIKAVSNVVRSHADGVVVSSLLGIGGNSSNSKWRDAVVYFASVSLLGATASGTIEHLRFYLIAAYRGRLSRYFHQRYFNKLTYYYGSVLDDRIEDADTEITNYCGEFAEHFAELPYYFLLPLFEALTALAVVKRQVGTGPAMAMSTVVLLSLALLRKLSPKFGKIHAALLAREEDFRRLHMDMRHNTEQIAMHDAGGFTRHRLDEALGRVLDAMKQMALAKGHFQMLEQAFSSCIWDVVAFVLCGRLVQQSTRESERDVLSSIVVQRRLIGDFYSSVTALIVNFRELSHLTEFTEKLARFDAVLDSIARNEFVRKPDPRFVHSDGSFLVPTKEEYVSVTKGVPSVSPAVNHNTRSPDSAFDSPVHPPEDCLIEFDNVDISTPNGVVLISGLTFTVHRGDNWAITGPNGCGKSSILRVLGKMWLPSAGSVIVNPKVDFYFLPQQVYMVSNCTLCEQIIFPDTDAPEKYFIGRIKEALELATGELIVTEVIGDWDSPVVGLHPDTCDRSFDWSSLSGGQQQKMALARLFYHARVSVEGGRTPVAVMDESTSQMDHDAEAHLFTNLRRAGVEILSVSHRAEVVRHHNRVLELTRHAEKWSIIRREKIAIMATLKSDSFRRVAGLE